MLNFEASIKDWMKSKRKNVLESKEKEEQDKTIETHTKQLLVSLGKNELVEKTYQNLDELVRIAMKEYSKKLTEIYQQELNNR